MNVLLLLLFCFATSYTVYKIYRIRDWERRPKRLCTSCHIVTKPDQKRDRTFICMVCGAPEPVELRSRAATAHFQLIGRRPPHESE